MIKLRIKELLNRRGIKDVYTHLKKNGVSARVAGNISRDEQNKLSLALLEKLCDIGHCSANEVLVYIPKNEAEAMRKTYLAPMLPDKVEVNAAEKLKSINQENLKKVEEFMKGLE